MEAQNNFILTELLWNSEDKGFINDLIVELANEAITLEIEYLDEDSFATESFIELKSVIDQTLETNRKKLNCIRGQDFEGAAFFRNEQLVLLNQMEAQGFSLYTLGEGKYVVYHVNVDKKSRKIKFIVYTTSEDCAVFLKRISEGKSI